jgi:hypothetical protein
MTWARLLKRVFDIDIERCACGGKLKLVAVIEEPAVIEKILTHLGLAAQPRGGWNCFRGLRRLENRLVFTGAEGVARLWLREGSFSA